MVSRAVPLADDALLHQLVQANQILANEGVLDAFGHVSVRDLADPTRFVVSRSYPPMLVEVGDLQLFSVEGQRIAGDDRASYAEVPIHAAIYRRRADVNAVCHSHALSVLPFSVSSVPLQPIFHLGSSIGMNVPVWDIADQFGATDLLVRTRQQGDDLARALGDANVALMRGHGCVVAASNLFTTVFTAIYLERNASVLLQALSLGPVRGLSAEETALASKMNAQPLSLERAWQYWVRRLPARSTPHRLRKAPAE